jgi:zinc transporter ZupT
LREGDLRYEFAYLFGGEATELINGAMVSSLSLLVGAVVAWFVYTTATGLASNIAKARKSGIPYIIVRKFQPGYLASQGP